MAVIKQLHPELQARDRQYKNRTVALLLLCGIAAFVGLAIRLGQVMLRDHEQYLSSAVETQLRSTEVTAARGTIYDAEGKILAQSATVETIYICPVEMQKYNEDPAAIARGLSRILGVDYASIMRKWENTSSWYETIMKKVEKDLADQVRTFKKEGNYASIHLIEDSKRYYPYGSQAAQIIGFVGAENHGMEGIEAVYDSMLQGENGRIVRTTTAGGTAMLFTGYEDYEDASDGLSAELTINNTIQYYLKKNMEQAINDYEIRSGAMGVVMEVETGAVLACCTLPDYDCNDYLTLNDTYQQLLNEAVETGVIGEGLMSMLDLESRSALAKLEEERTTEKLTDEEISLLNVAFLHKQWGNRVIGDTYEPGSTFKSITLASALEEGVVSDNDNFRCDGSMMVRGRDTALHCWKRTGHGDQNLAEAAQHSCNVAFATMGIRLGARKFYEYMKAFGFFDRTGIDLGGAESAGVWWPDDVFMNPYNYSQLAAASFGQTFNITPIQLITAVCAVANGGYLMKPYVVKRWLRSDGTVERTMSPTVVRQVISEETSRRVCEILESVVSAPGGTGKNAGVAGYRIAGKTATSEKVGQASDEYMVSFAGFAPADDPKVAVLIILDNPDPNSGIYISGGAMAAPVVGNVLADILPYLGVQENSGSEAVNAAVPNVKVRGLEDARRKLEDTGFQVKIVGDGDTVTDQAPMPGMRIALGSTVVLYAGEQKPNTMVAVPNMVGKSFTAAKQYLEAFGLFVRTTGVAPTGSKYIQVQRQSLEPGLQVTYGTVVEVGLMDTDTSIMETRG